LKRKKYCRNFSGDKSDRISNVIDMRKKFKAFNSLTDAQKLVIDLAYYEGVDET